MNKKMYVKPELTTHGNVEQITLGGGSVNKDSLTGPNNTAFPNRR
jgi:hypothetical protein